MPQLPPITVTVAELRRLSGLGRSTIFEMLRRGELERVKFGARTLIVLASYQRLVDQQLSTRVPDGP